MDMIVLAIHLDQLLREICVGIGKYGTLPVDGVSVEHSATIFRHKDKMDVHLENVVPSASGIVVISHRPRA